MYMHSVCAIPYILGEATQLVIYSYAALVWRHGSRHGHPCVTPPGWWYKWYLVGSYDLIHYPVPVSWLQSFHQVVAGDGDSEWVGKCLCVFFFETRKISFAAMRKIVAFLIIFSGKKDGMLHSEQFMVYQHVFFGIPETSLQGIQGYLQTSSNIKPLAEEVGKTNGRPMEAHVQVDINDLSSLGKDTSIVTVISLFVEMGCWIPKYTQKLIVILHSSTMVTILYYHALSKKIDLSWDKSNNSFPHSLKLT